MPVALCRPRAPYLQLLRIQIDKPVFYTLASPTPPIHVPDEKTAEHHHLFAIESAQDFVRAAPSVNFRGRGNLAGHKPTVGAGSQRLLPHCEFPGIALDWIFQITDLLLSN